MFAQTFLKRIISSYGQKQSVKNIILYGVRSTEFVLMLCWSYKLFPYSCSRYPLIVNGFTLLAANILARILISDFACKQPKRLKKDVVFVKRLSINIYNIYAPPKRLSTNIYCRTKKAYLWTSNWSNSKTTHACGILPV